jgi:hypothetical protein
MGWRGTLRSINALLREAERDARRRAGQQLRAERERLAQLERQHAAAAVQEYESYVNSITSVHKAASTPVDWVRLAQSGPPKPPERTRKNEDAARIALATFRPSMLDKILGRTDTKTTALKRQIHSAIMADEQDFHTCRQRYEADLLEWEQATERAKQVLKDGQLIIDTIRKHNPFTAISELGSQLDFKVDETMLLTVSVNVHSEDIIPNEEFGFCKSGKLAFKKLPKAKYYELYQDYVCGVVLRIAREICALLPIDGFIITAEDEILNSATGKIDPQPILSVYVRRATLQSLNFERVDPSDAMKNFVHNMDFKKTQGFKPVVVVRVPNGS